MGRTIILTAAAILLAAALVVIGMQLGPGQQLNPSAAAQPATAPARTITVVGSGSTFVEPDVAQANVGVNVSEETIDEASEQVNERMSAVMAALGEMGVAEEDIQTSNYSIYFEEQPIGPNGEPLPGKYRVSNEVRVTIRELDRVAEILDAVIEAGANNIYGVSFTREEIDAARSDARAQAIEDAQAKAQEYADLNELTLGDVVVVSEVIGNNVPLFDRSYAAQGLGGGAGPSITPGQLEVLVQVEVTYAASK